MRGSFQAGKNNSGEGLVELTLVVFGDSHSELYNASGVTVAKLLSVRHNVSYSGGLRCIDRACSSGSQFWHLEINGKASLLGVNDYKVSPGDKILLSYE